MTLWIPAQKALVKADPAFKPVIRAVGDCTITPQKTQPYAALLSAIAHQQLHGKAAATILGRFTTLYNGRMPKPAELLATTPEQLRACGFSTAKSAALLDVALKAQEGVIPTLAAANKLDNEELIVRMTAPRGVGRWTVEMFLMFTLGRPDVLPVDDFGIREGYKALHNLPAQPKPKELLAIGERWAPWRTVASWYLWRALELSRQR